MKEMQAGVSAAKTVRVIEDRAEAIETAINLATPDDLVAVLGKGHERFQIMGDQQIEFSDAAVCREALERRLST